MSKIQKSSSKKADLVFSWLDAIWLVDFKVLKGVTTCWIVVVSRDGEGRPEFLISLQMPVLTSFKDQSAFEVGTRFMDWPRIISAAKAAGSAEVFTHKPESLMRRGYAETLVRFIFDEVGSDPVVDTFFSYGVCKGLGVSSPVELISRLTGLSVNTVKMRISRSKAKLGRNA